MKKIITPALVISCLTGLALPSTLPSAYANDGKTRGINQVSTIITSTIETGNLVINKETERKKEQARQKQLEKQKELEKQKAEAAKKAQATVQSSRSASRSSALTSRSEPGNRFSSVISIAQKYIGVPYRAGGTTPSGFDCSGFVQYVYKQTGVSLPHSSSAMYQLGTSVRNLQPGDLVFFKTNGSGISHVGIYVGGNRFISSTSSSGVRIDSLGDGYWGPRYVGAKRL